MNSILAFVLTVIIVHAGMIAIHVVLTTILTLHIAITGKMQMSRDELEEEIRQRVLGRIVFYTYPVVFWWVLAWNVIQELRHHD